MQDKNDITLIQVRKEDDGHAILMEDNQEMNTEFLFTMYSPGSYFFEEGNNKENEYPRGTPTKNRIETITASTMISPGSYFFEEGNNKKNEYPRGTPTKNRIETITASTNAIKKSTARDIDTMPMLRNGSYTLSNGTADKKDNEKTNEEEMESPQRVPLYVSRKRRREMGILVAPFTESEEEEMEKSDEKCKAAYDEFKRLYNASLSSDIQRELRSILQDATSSVALPSTRSTVANIGQDATSSVALPSTGRTVANIEQDAPSVALPSTGRTVANIEQDAPSVALPSTGRTVANIEQDAPSVALPSTGRTVANIEQDAPSVALPSTSCKRRKTTLAQCHICKKWLQSGNMTRHMNHVHQNTAHFGCSYCSVTFTRMDSLTRHTKIYHSGPQQENRFNCTHCSSNFATSRQLSKHMMQTHIRPKSNNICLKCGEIYTGADFHDCM